MLTLEMFCDLPLVPESEVPGRIWTGKLSSCCAIVSLLSTFSWQSWRRNCALDIVLFSHFDNFHFSEEAGKALGLQQLPTVTQVPEAMLGWGPVSLPAMFFPLLLIPGDLGQPRHLQAWRGYTLTQTRGPSPQPDSSSIHKALGVLVC